MSISTIHNQSQSIIPVPQKILIRCDAAPEIGFGHVVRCLALADELRNSHGCQVDFAMLQGPQGVAQVQDQGYAVFQPSQGIENLDEGAWLQDLITGKHHQVLVLDVRTDLANEAVQSIRESGVVIVTIDDPSDRRLHADLAFYPPVPQVERMDWTGFTGKYFIGWDWVLLRPQFAEAAQQANIRGERSKSASQSNERKLTILVTMGGSDPEGLTIIAIDAIEQIAGNFHVVLIIGRGFMHQAALKKRLAVAERNYEIHHNVINIAQLMLDSDLAISTFGVTAYELASVKTPSIQISLTIDHEESCRALLLAGLACSLGLYHSVTPDIMARKIDETINAFKGNSEYPSIIDGCGYERIAREIKARL